MLDFKVCLQFSVYPNADKLSVIYKESLWKYSICGYCFVVTTFNIIQFIIPFTVSLIQVKRKTDILTISLND